MPPPPPTVGPRPHPAPSVRVAGKPPAHSSLEEGVGPPTGRRAVGHRVRDVGSAGPFLKPAVPWPAARKTLCTVRQIRGPRRGPFVFLGASDLHPLTPFHPGAGPPAPCRLFLLSADVLGPSECAEGPSHLGEAGVALCSRTGGLWLLLPTHVAARRPRCCPSHVIGRTAAPTAAGLTGESEMRK